MVLGKFSLTLTNYFLFLLDNLYRNRANSNSPFEEGSILRGNAQTDPVHRRLRARGGVPSENISPILVTMICLLHAVITVWRAFLAEMAGQQTGLNGRETKLALMAGEKISSKETRRGH